MPRDCTVERKLAVMYSPSRKSGIQYNMQRQRKTQQAQLSKKRSRRSSVRELDSTMATQRTMMPSAVATQFGVRTSRTVVVGRMEVAMEVALAQGAFNVTTSLSDSTRLIHPGNVLMFPWLSNIAPCYEKYRIRRLTFNLISGAPTSASGLIYLAIDTDPTDPAPTTVGDLMGNVMSAAGNVWQGVSLVADSRMLMAGVDWRYTAGRVNEPRTTYCGQLLIAASGLDVVRSLTLEAHYELEFAVEQTPAGGMQTASQAVYGVSNASSVSGISLSTGLVGAVMSGQGAPMLVGGPTWYGGIAPYAFDIGSLRKGTIVHEATTAKSSASPTTLLSGASIDLALYDWAGHFLGYGSSLAACDTTRGCSDFTALDSVGAIAKMTQSVILSRLIALLPSVRYLAPLLIQTVTGDSHLWNAWIS
jgi:hypothetical protein